MREREFGLAIKSLVSRIFARPRFSTHDVKIGRWTTFGRNVKIKSHLVRIGKGVVFHDNIQINSSVLIIGDGVIIQEGVKINASEFTIGDYGTIYFGCFFPGPGTLHIGHNFWLGNNSVVDCLGGTTIGNNVGIGAHSQLWSHMKFGDVIAGCRFHTTNPLTIGNDVWLVGHNLVAPVTIEDRVLAMLGSLIVKDIPADRTVAGSPAKDVTDKFGAQFVATDSAFRLDALKRRIEKFAIEKNVPKIWEHIEICSGMPTVLSDQKTIIDVVSRTYRKTGSRVEMEG
ncbi:MAG: hypothetical protein FJZ87_16585, partial [Chloroflexi bacterium]|nr:hypothetical protein [Chloroflexota bacterium]